VGKEEVWRPGGKKKKEGRLVSLTKEKKERRGRSRKQKKEVEERDSHLSGLGKKAAGILHGFPEPSYCK